MTRSVLKLLEDNRKTIQSLNNTKNGTIIINSNNENNTDTRTISEILEDILEQEQWKGKRASKLDLDDFLQLLVEFNTAGIHFS
jgi:18S rRNA (adenine1779-N6/adenine1780-N6)-dimethyltransferase